MSNPTTPRAVLSIYVSETALEGVLLEAGEGPARLVHRMVRQRQRKGEMIGTGNLESVVPGLKSSDESDFTIQIGDGSSGDDADLSMMMGDTIGGDVSASENGGAHHSISLPFDGSLREMVAECAQMGYPEPEIAFCTGPPEVSLVELTVAAGASDAQPSRKKLLELLEGTHSGAFDRARVAFYPMTPKGGNIRFLAVVPDLRDSVTRSLQSLHERRQPLAATPRLMEAEATLLAGLMSRQPAVEETMSVLVRVGSDDTLLLFFEGNELRHYERLRSLTSYDVPETICSRVMLQQDEQKIRSIEKIFVLGTNEERLIEAFRSFYPDSAVLPLQEAFPPEQWDPAASVGMLSPGRVVAVATALRILYPTADGGGVNLLGTAPRRRRRSISMAWHTAMALLVLIGSVGFFGWQYMEGAAELERQRVLMAQDPVQLPETGPEELRAEIQRLEATYQEHTRALQVLDSLLVGSDMWSRTFERTSALTGAIDRIWFRGWQPDGDAIRIEGFSLSRSSVALLGRRLNATIERLEYNETNNVRLYSFTMRAPLERAMPEVALYLREIAEGAEQEEVTEDAAPMLEDDRPHE